MTSQTEQILDLLTTKGIGVVMPRGGATSDEVSAYLGACGGKLYMFSEADIARLIYEAANNMATDLEVSVKLMPSDEVLLARLNHEKPFAKINDQVMDSLATKKGFEACMESVRGFANIFEGEAAWFKTR